MDCAAAGRTRPGHCNASNEKSKRKQFHDGEHGVKVEEGGPQQRGRLAGEGGSRDCRVLQVPSGVHEKEESPCTRGTENWAEDVGIACSHVSPAPVASFQFLAHPWSDAVVVLRRIVRA